MGNSPRYVGFIDPPYIVTLTDDSGAALNLTGCTSNSFTLTMLNQNTGLSQQGVGVWTITDAVNGKASYQWTNADMATAGPWWIYSTVKLPAEPSPREFDPELILILSGTVGAGAAPPGVLPAPIAKALFFNGADYGVVGDGSDQTVAFNAMLAAAHAAGGGVAYVDAPNVTISAPLRIYSNTTLMLSPKTTITLATNSSCNILQNYAVQANRRIIDGVTNSTTTFTSATAAFVAGDVGSAIRIYYQDSTYLDTTIASRTNSTTVTLAASTTQNGTALYAAIGAGRDSNITIIGGTWVRAINNFGSIHNGWDGHHIRIVQCDRVTIGPLRIQTLSGKYALSLADCTTFHVQDIYSPSSYSDLLHVNGPAWDGFIERIQVDSPGDDIISLTGGDYHVQQQWLTESMGNITSVKVDGVNVSVGPVTYPRAVNITPGQSTALHAYTLDKITVRNVRSALPNYPIYMAPDPADTCTSGGTWGRILIEDIINDATVPPGGAVLAGTATITDLEIRSVIDRGASRSVYIDSASTITNLVISGVPFSQISMQGTVTSYRLVPSYVGVFGDGSDGAAILNGSTTNSWSSLSGSTYTMTRDAFLTSLIINPGVTLIVAGCKILCSGAITNSGTIRATGNNATSSTGAASSGSGGSLNGSGAGANGTTGAGANASSYWSIGTAPGGNGGAGVPGAAGSGGTAFGNNLPWMLRSGVTSCVLTAPGQNAPNGFSVVLSGAPGGGGGGGDGTNAGGGGGSGGGVILLAAYSVTNSGTISAAGGNGFAPTLGNAGGGGGGGGGLILVYSLSAWTAGTTNVNGGTFGSGHGTGSAGSNGSVGQVLNVILA